MIFKKIVLGLSLGLAAFSTSCGSSKKKSSAIVAPLPQMTKYFVHGNPMEMLADTSADKSGLISAAEFENFNNYQLAGAINFAQKTDEAEVKRITNQEELEAENSTSETGEPFISNYKFTKIGNSYIYEDSRPQAAGYPAITFAHQNGKLVIKSVQGSPVEGIHYSVKADGEAFSILLQSRDASGLSLTGLYFIKSKATRTQARKVTSEANYYVEGDGKAIPWKRDISIDLCGQDAEKNKAYVTNAMTAWQQAGGFEAGRIGTLNYTVNVKPIAQPFTDLNQNCVNFISNYRMEDQENTAIFGAALPIIDQFDQEIINSQIFIFNRAMTRFSQPTQPVVTHEIGHALGLGHKFEDFAANPTMSSIMGYDGTSSITQADEATIKNLYPVLPDAPEEVVKGLLGN